MMKHSRNMLLIVLFVGLGVMTVAYAAFSTSLSIKSSAKVNNSKWDIHFANLTQVANSSGNTGTVISPPTIQNGATQITGLVADLKKPGDSVSYTFDIVNNGDINAKITSVSIATPNCGANTSACSKMEYSVKYTSSGLTPAVGNTLNKNSSVNATLTIKYKDNNPLTDSNDVSISGLDVTINYGQN